MSKNQWAFPFPGGKIISPYGGNRGHKGLDIKTVPKDKIHAVFDGTVIYSASFSDYGYCIIIKHEQGL